MPTIFSDPPLWLFGLLGLAAGAPIVAAFLLPQKTDAKAQSRQRRICFAAAAVAVVALAGLVICDRLFESDREQIVRKLRVMSVAVRENDLNRVFEHISPRFKKGAHDKQSLRSFADSARRAGQVTEIKIWDENLESLEPETGRAVVRFSVKFVGSAGTDVPYMCRAHFSKESDGQWRLHNFDIYNPLVDQNTPMSIPGLQ
jgi:hypothetical protein